MLTLYSVEMCVFCQMLSFKLNAHTTCQQSGYWVFMSLLKAVFLNHSRHRTYLCIIQLLQPAFVLSQLVSPERLAVHLLGGLPQPLLQTLLIPSQVQGLFLPPHIFHHHGLLLLTCLVAFPVRLRQLFRWWFRLMTFPTSRSLSCLYVTKWFPLKGLGWGRTFKVSST